MIAARNSADTSGIVIPNGPRSLCIHRTLPALVLVGSVDYARRSDAIHMLGDERRASHSYAPLSAALREPLRERGRYAGALRPPGPPGWYAGVRRGCVCQPSFNIANKRNRVHSPPDSRAHSRALIEHISAHMPLGMTIPGKVRGKPMNF